jgi:hypothetical protein
MEYGSLRYVSEFAVTNNYTATADIICNQTSLLETES